NDSDVDNVPPADANAGLSVGTPRPMTDPAHGTLTLKADGSFVYTPFANYHGTDSFTYITSDGIVVSNVATVTITVNEVNDPVVATADAAAGNEDTATTGNVLANDTDADNPDGLLDNDEVLSVTAHTDPAHGTVSIAANGDFTYTPFANYHGGD